MSVYVIEKEALIRNIKRVEEKAGVPVIGVVKGNGYGLGTAELAGILFENGIKTLAVTEPEDIAKVRSAAEGCRILVMRSTCIPEEAEMIAQNGCIATVGSAESGLVMSRAAEKLGRRVECHLKIDTGLGRYGFMPGQEDEAASVYGLPGLDFTGAYTHFSNAFRSVSLTKEQQRAFVKMTEELKARGVDPGMLHCASSSALFNAEDVAMQGVRIGSAFTGRLICSKDTGLERIGFLESEVVEVKDLPAGHSVGYGGTYTARRPVKIAVIPMGHMDGLGISPSAEKYTLRSVLGTLKRFIKDEGIYVHIKGRKCRLIGRIGLTHCVADITGTDIAPGDKVRADVSPVHVNAAVRREFR